MKSWPFSSSLPAGATGSLDIETARVHIVHMGCVRPHRLQKRARPREGRVLWRRLGGGLPKAAAAGVFVAPNEPRLGPARSNRTSSVGRCRSRHAAVTTQAVGMQLAPYQEEAGIGYESRGRMTGRMPRHWQQIVHDVGLDLDNLAIISFATSCMSKAR